MFDLAGMEMSIQFQRVADSLGYMRETKREGEIDRVEADISLFGRCLPVIMVIDGLITFQIVETLRTKVVDVVAGKGKAVNQFHPI